MPKKELKEVKLVPRNFSNDLTESEKERLAILAEEAGEVVQAVCKILRHGYGSRNPDIVGSPSNRTNLAKEIGHLENAVIMLRSSRDIQESVMLESLVNKNISIRRHLHHQGL